MAAIEGEAKGYLGILDVYDVARSRRPDLTIRTENSHTHRNAVNHFEKHPDDVKPCEMERAYKKSRYRLCMSEIDPKLPQHLIVDGKRRRTGGEPLSADSSGFATNRNNRWIDAKYGPKETKSFKKMHMMGVSHGKICAAQPTGARPTRLY